MAQAVATARSPVQHHPPPPWLRPSKECPTSRRVHRRQVDPPQKAADYIFYYSLSVGDVIDKSLY